MVSSFIKYLEAEKRRSPNTVTNYRRDIDQFLEYLGVEEVDFDPAAVSADDIREWIVSLTEKGLKPTSVNRMISAVGSMYTYFMRKGIVDKNPFLKISQLKTPRNLPTYVPETKMVSIINELVLEGTAEGEDAFIAKRNALMVHF